MRDSICAHHAAVVTTRTSIVDVKIAHAFIGKETLDGVLDLAPVHDFRAPAACSSASLWLNSGANRSKGKAIN